MNSSGERTVGDMTLRDYIATKCLAANVNKTGLVSAYEDPGYHNRQALIAIDMADALLRMLKVTPNA